MFSHGEALSDGKFNIKEEDSCSESCAGFNGLFGITENTSNTRERSEKTYDYTESTMSAESLLIMYYATLHNQNII